MRLALSNPSFQPARALRRLVECVWPGLKWATQSRRGAQTETIAALWADARTA